MTDDVQRYRSSRGEVRTCLACGHSGTDVSMSLVKYDDPQPVQITVPVAHDRRGQVTGNTVETVPGRYGSEWRCTDVDGCGSRARAQAAADLERARASRERAPW